MNRRAGLALGWAWVAAVIYLSLTPSLPTVSVEGGDKVGHFFARDTYNGRNIIAVFRWDVRNPKLPIWSQAFSTDEGRTWEWNSINVSERAR